MESDSPMNFHALTGLTLVAGLLLAPLAAQQATNSPATRPLLLANYYCWYHDGQHPMRPSLYWTYPSSATNVLARKAQKPGELPPSSVFRPLVGPGRITTQGDEVRLAFESAVPMKFATLHYATDTGLRSMREWKCLPAQIGKDVVTAPEPPAGANTWFIALTDERGAVVTSTVQFQP